MGLGLFDLHPYRLLLHLVIVGFVEEVSVELVEVLGDWVHWANIDSVGFADHSIQKGLVPGIVEVL